MNDYGYTKKINNANLVIQVLIIMSLGPFVYKELSLRLIDIGLLFFFIISLKSLIIKKIDKEFVIYNMIFLVLILSTLLNVNNLNKINFLASFNRFLQFILVFVICKRFNYFNILSLNKYFLYILSLNSLIIIFQLVSAHQIVRFVREYWFLNYEYSISYRAQQLGRFTGLIRQPLESGLMYSFGFFSMAYSYLRTKQKVWFLFFPLILIGGILSVSKIFILVAIPLVIIFIHKNGSLGKIIFSFSILFILLIIMFRLIENWEFKSYLLRLVDFNNFKRGIDFLTAGRFGGENLDVQDLFSNLLVKAPILGFGVGSTKLLDNAIIEFLYQGGVIALFFYIYWQKVYLFKIVKLKNKLDRGYMITLFIFISISSIGAPIFTYSSFSTFIGATFFYFTNSNSLNRIK